MNTNGASPAEYSSSSEEHGTVPLTTNGSVATMPTLLEELWASTDLIFQSRLTWLLALGPFAVVGDATNMLGESLCFACAGIAMIPCAERLSFITEQVAEHTNGTIGALLNATFGNAPELLISVAALRAGFYRVVQLAMLGSMLTNMLLVFGVSCWIGGCRYQVQELRTTSGSVSVTMLLVATAGSLFPAALRLSGQMPTDNIHANVPTMEEVTFCRVNAVVMLILYVAYLVFQLGTHKEEFDDDPAQASHKRHARRNVACLRFTERIRLWYSTRGTSAGARAGNHVTSGPGSQGSRTLVSYKDGLPLLKSHASDQHIATAGSARSGNSGGLSSRTSSRIRNGRRSDGDEEAAMGALHFSDGESSVCRSSEEEDWASEAEDRVMADSQDPASARYGHHQRRRRRQQQRKLTTLSKQTLSPAQVQKSKSSDIVASDVDEDDACEEQLYSSNDESHAHVHSLGEHGVHPGGPLISMRVGVIWLFVITLCISAMSDILVETIDSFSQRMHLSQVFTSMVIIPFFSNVAEQVSAFLFAYRNEMDLCVGVTVGSAVQIATFVLPGSVLIGAVMDRSMTLYFHGYETTCLFFGTIVTVAVLQGGTSNWLTGAMMVGIYVMMATGVYFHELEDLSLDAELLIRNMTTSRDV
jgi:Ca2+/H+ antiporter